MKSTKKNRLIRILNQNINLAQLIWVFRED